MNMNAAKQGDTVYLIDNMGTSPRVVETPAVVMSVLKEVWGDVLVVKRGEKTLKVHPNNTIKIPSILN